MQNKSEEEIDLISGLTSRNIHRNKRGGFNTKEIKYSYVTQIESEK